MAAHTRYSDNDKATRMMDDARPDDNVSAQKRVAIGLSPKRPTAREDVRRPPDGGEEQPRAAGWFPLEWLLALLVVTLAGATLLLLAARLAGAPTQWSYIASALDRTAGQSPATTVAESPFTVDGYRELVAGGFGPDDYHFAAVDRPEQVRMETLPDAGLFRMQVHPGYMAWITPGSACLAPHRFEADATVLQESADGYAGLVGRVVDSHNFYLFAVDGGQRYQVMLQRDGKWSTLRSWTPSARINPAGRSNLLALEDDGQHLRFMVNGADLFATEIVRLPAGHAGLAAGAQDRRSTVDVDWFALYDRPCRAAP